MTTSLAEKLPAEQPKRLPIRTDEDGWRWSGNKIHVTTVLENAVANPKLMDWMKKNSERKVEQVRTDAARFGTECHQYYEKLLTGQSLGEIPESHKAQVAKFQKWAEEKRLKPHFVEIEVISETFGFIGGVDYFGDIEDTLSIADWKNAKRYRITNGWQMGAYRIAARETPFLLERYSREVLSNIGLVGLQLDPRAEFPKMFKYQHFDFVEHAFLCSLEVFKALYFNKLAKLEWPWLKERAV